MHEWTAQGQAKLTAAREHHTKALTCMAQHRLDAAIAKLQDALKLRRTVVPADHRLVVGTLELLAHVAVTSGRKEEGQQWLRELLEAQRSCFGRSHPEVEATTTRLQAVCQELGDFDEASLLGEEVWAARTAAFRQDPVADLERLLEELRPPERKDHLAAALADHEATNALRHVDLSRAVAERVERLAAERTARDQHHMLVGSAQPSRVDPALAALLRPEPEGRPRGASHDSSRRASSAHDPLVRPDETVDMSQVPAGFTREQLLDAEALPNVEYLLRYGRPPPPVPSGGFPRIAAPPRQDPVDAPSGGTPPPAPPPAPEDAPPAFEDTPPPPAPATPPAEVTDPDVSLEADAPVSTGPLPPEPPEAVRDAPVAPVVDQTVPDLPTDDPHVPTALPSPEDPPQPIPAPSPPTST